MQDKELLTLLLRDAEQGLDVAIREYGGAVRTIVRAFLIGHSEEDIEETVSDTFVALWRTAGKIDLHRAPIRAYVYGIARNCAKNKRKTLKKRDAEVAYEAAPEPIDTKTPESECIDRLNAQLILDMFRLLRPPADRVFLLRFAEQKSVQEIADQLHLTVKQVENALYRGKKKLKAMFEERRLDREGF